MLDQKEIEKLAKETKFDIFLGCFPTNKFKWFLIRKFIKLLGGAIMSQRGN